MTTIVIDNTRPRLDVDGVQVDAHDGALEFFEGRYYWYGTAYGETDGFATSQRYVVYSSDDLVSWQPHGGLLDPGDGGVPEGHYYRPYVKRARDGRYVLWFNWMPTFADGRLGVAVSDRPTGPFEIVTTDASLALPDAGDLGLFVDEDGSGYLIYSARIKTAHDIVIERLTDDLRSATGETSGVLATNAESPTMFRRGDVYYALFDTTSCFGPSGTGARVFTAASPLGPYLERENINRRADCLPCGGGPTIAAQQAHVARIPTAAGDDAYVWIGDRWGTALDGFRGHDHQYWSEPLRFRADGSIEPLRHVNRWEIELASP